MSDQFFPNQSAYVQEQEARLRKIAAVLPEPERLVLYEIFSACTPGLTKTTFRVEENYVVALQAGREITFPRPVPLIKLSHIVYGYEEWLQRKYCLPGFVEVQPGDVVVDCGAYVSGFSLSASRIASQLHAFEPDRENANCSRRNLSDAANAKLNECGLYDHSDEMTLNVSANSVEHSLLLPDDGTVIERRSIRVVSLADYARANNIDRYDFVKIEAEGVELEVFAGLADMRPRKVAIDVSPERNGESPADEFRMRLESLGYEVRQRGLVMFAHLRDPSRTLTNADGSRPRSTISRIFDALRRPTQKAKDLSDENAARNASVPTVPKIIYSLWLQGLEDAPELVRLNFERWGRLNPHYRLEILDRAAVLRLLAGTQIKPDTLTHQALSDVVRLRLLHETGGIWVDATVLPTQPLDDWLPAMMTESGFFAFEKPAPDRPISSWFLAATPANSMVKAWWQKISEFWSSTREAVEGIPEDPIAAVTTTATFPYFWFHYLFQLLVERDAHFAASWAACAKFSADAPHAMQMRFAAQLELERDEVVELAAAAPLHKLNWRAPYPLETLAAL
ncbi:FkbM family methyltransferase [Paraburkholderia sp. Ac-20347]|jgi:FkbM family methyltransferase|uniref:FkbM family methyltransferase n=1 Tax=Paraburkholderia sp. Ac-20347 TaxID=2703892 RepID=UPI0019805E36|nr:FkbM family methyltransferase [Paraburkholderia sp. Ac-20347]MBN3809598.1 FkbM family methyltransferase [Paraburkholderia sp. Ac-20347]